MRLGVDAREIQDGTYTGIGRPLVNFLNYFSKQGNADTCVLFTERDIQLNFGPRVSNVVIPSTNTLMWDQWLLPKAIKKEKIDLFYSPYYKIPLLKPCLMVSAILDLMYLAYEPYYREMSLLSKVYYAVMGRIFAFRADKILTCSQYSKQDIEHFYGVNPKKIEIIPLSIAPIYFSAQNSSKISEIKKKYQIKRRYILYMGNFKPHKNVAGLINAFTLIAPLFTDVSLVLAGPKEHTYLQLVEMVKIHKLEDRVIFTGKIFETDEPQYLYQGAEVLVMPTFYEGFGLPPLEAMACGVAVISSRVTSVPEIVGDAGILIDPSNTSDLAHAIKKILNGPALKQELINKGLRHAKNYESEQIARDMYDFLKKQSGVR